MVAANIDCCQRAQQVEHLVWPRSISHHIAKIPKLIETSANGTSSDRKNRFKRVQISVYVRYNERAHSRPV
jgi:hypothetical protein